MAERHVLGLSGGRDSAALAVYVRQTMPEIDVEYFFTDTGKELPEVYEFLGRLEGFLGKPILRLNPRRDFDFWLRAGLHGPFVHVPEVLATWRSHPGSTSISDVSEEKISEYVRVMERFFEQEGVGPDLMRLRPQALAMAHHIAALKTMWIRRPQARRHLARSLRLHPTLRSRHPSHPRSLKIILRTFLLPQALDRALLTRWMKLRYGRQPTF